MDLIHATVLGALQGLTEVLPISSSAHLIILPHLLGWPESGLTFDVALHVGTLLALLIYFRRDVADLLFSFGQSIAGSGFATTRSRLPLIIIAASVPAAIVGKTMEHRIEELFRSNLPLIAGILITFGILLAVADAIGICKYKLDRMTLATGLIIGLAQCLALVPGVSRSGITITAALLLGFNREASARFSFLLSIPIVAGAAALKLGKLLATGFPASELPAFAIGIGSSAIFGLMSVAYLLKLVQTRSLSIFVWYRVLAGGIFLALILTKTQIAG